MNFEPILNTAVKLSFTVGMLSIAAVAAVFMQPSAASVEEHVQLKRETFAVHGYIARDGCLVLQMEQTPVWALCDDNTHAALED